MQKDDSLCIGAIMEASYQTRRVMQGIIEMVDYLKYNQDILLSESENDLFHLYFELVIQAEMNHYDVTPLKERMDKIAEVIRKLNIYDDKLVSYRLNEYKNQDSKRAMARHTDSLPFRDLFAGVKRLLSDDGIFSAIVPVEVVEQFVAESCILGFYLIRKCGVKTVERKQPKRFMLSFAKHRISPYEECVETMMDSQGNRSEWYRKIMEEFYLF